MHAIDGYARKATTQKKATTTAHIYSGYISSRTLGGKKGNAWELSVEGRTVKKNFGEGGEVWDSASSGSQRRTNNFNDNSPFNIRRNEGHPDYFEFSISSFATRRFLSSIARSKLEADGTNVFSNEREKREERESERNSYDASHDFFFFLFVFLFTRDCLDASCYILHRSQSVLVEADFRPPLPSPILPPSSVIAIAVATHNGDRTCCVSPFECVRIEGANFSARTEHRIRSRGYYTATVLLDER